MKERLRKATTRGRGQDGGNCCKSAGRLLKTIRRSGAVIYSRAEVLPGPTEPVVENDRQGGGETDDSQRAEQGSPTRLSQPTARFAETEHMAVEDAVDPQHRP